jgi:methanogenic corrinoid protein MtbC1
MVEKIVSDNLVNAIADMKEELALQITNNMLTQGVAPHIILEDCNRAMKLVGNRFQRGEYFLPELIYTGEMLKIISQMVKPYLFKNNVTKVKKGKVLIGSVQGDTHDIGKNIVVFILDGNGYEVKDIGVDVSPDRFVDEIIRFKPEIVALSGLLTLAYTSMKKIVEAISEAGLREKVKIMIGGGAIDERVRMFTGADAFGTDAFDAVGFADTWMGNYDYE